MAVLPKWSLSFMDGEGGPTITGTVWCVNMDAIDALVEAQYPNQWCMNGTVEKPEEHIPEFVADE